MNHSPLRIHHLSRRKMPDTANTLMMPPAPRRMLIHRLRLGSWQASIDLLTGMGYQHDGSGRFAQALGATERRLALLDWVRRRLPVPSYSALWTIEAASLAARTREHHWHKWACADLPRAVESVLGASSDLPGRTRRALTAMTAAASSNEPTSDALEGLIHDLKQNLLHRWVWFGSECSPVPEGIDGHSELEWDRIAPLELDLGELGLHSRVCGTVWTARAALRNPTNHPAPKTLWARLVNDVSGEVYDETVMRAQDGGLVARGFVPALARPAQTRIDLSVSRDQDARPRNVRQQVLREQQLFRTLFFARRASIGRGWAEWHRVYSKRSASGTNAPPLPGLPALDAVYGGPFLAELHVRPSDLAASLPSSLSPRGVSDRPDIT